MSNINREETKYVLERALPRGIWVLMKEFDKLDDAKETRDGFRKVFPCDTYRLVKRTVVHTQTDEVLDV